MYPIHSYLHSLLSVSEKYHLRSNFFYSKKLMHSFPCLLICFPSADQFQAVLYCSDFIGTELEMHASTYIYLYIYIQPCIKLVLLTRKVNDINVLSSHSAVFLLSSYFFCYDLLTPSSLYYFICTFSSSLVSSTLSGTGEGKEESTSGEMGRKIEGESKADE